ncbi:hypothetical protein BGZ61DRAFT_33097 [Ilyonectria robusta]|uniref:uncharacterized protein n=1 Tax=Ilyonectria robusta TaxID=1079257 RepID=UPI001E8E5F29|nr:uncharacterized protein BGZ61DRAFT_33097 [Ilyonectria robusta]KAH8694634.1 hypothetical protein BGZ61DRAFT_33097 [Ilyonectria robusta]
MAAVESTLAIPYLHAGLRGKYLLQEPTFTINQGSSADIDWMPNYEKYMKRTQARSELTGLATRVPKDWPQFLDSPLAWTSDSFPKQEEIVFSLTENQKEEIYSAVRHFQSLGLPVRDINRDNFPLPTLTSPLNAMADDLHNGKGFTIIRGLNSPTPDHDSIAFLGLSAYMAPQFGRQDQDGSMIVHIMDANNSKVPKEMRQSVYTNVAQPFHSDVFCEILALQVRSCADNGGNSIIASAWTVYNELAATRPDLIHTLAAGDWTFDTFGRDPAYHQRPLLFCEDGKVIMNFSRRILTGAPASPRSPMIPPITEAQAEALDAVHFTALKHQLSIPLQEGDIRFINNHAVLHGRDAFDDSDQSQRHLVRLWLRNPDKAWRMPTGLNMAWDRVYRDLGLEGDDESWPLMPVISEKRLMNRQASCGQG